MKKLFKLLLTFTIAGFLVLAFSLNSTSKISPVNDEITVCVDDLTKGYLEDGGKCTCCPGKCKKNCDPAKCKKNNCDPAKCKKQCATEKCKKQCDPAKCIKKCDQTKCKKSGKSNCCKSKK